MGLSVTSYSQVINASFFERERGKSKVKKLISNFIPSLTMINHTQSVKSGYGDGKFFELIMPLGKVTFSLQTSTKIYFYQNKFGMKRTRQCF